MEIVLLWLDELDDLVFAGFSIWGRVRGLCLAIALGAAVALHVLPRLGVLDEAVLALSAVSLAALACWGAVAVLSRTVERGGKATQA